MVKNTFCYFVGSWDIFEKEKTSEKGGIEIEDWRFSVPIVLGFQENSIYTLHLYFSKILQNSAKFIQKLIPVFKKSHEEFGQLQTTSGKCKKLKFDGLSLSKNTFLQLKHYIQGIYQTLLSTTFENLPDSLCQFWNHKSLFHNTTPLHFCSS